MQPLIVSRQVVQGVKDFLRAAFSGSDMPVGGMAGADTAAGVFNGHQSAGLPLSQAVGESASHAGHQPQPEASFDGLIDRFIDTDGNLFRGPYLTLPLPFRPQHAPADGQPAFPWLPAGFVPHAHQGRAFERLSGNDARSTLVATGTGSGKTECFLYPVLEHCRLQRALGRPGIKAIILYPMNALATDQATRLAREIVKTPALQDIRAGLYVGDTPDQLSKTVQQLPDGRFTVITDRHALCGNPPDILLTNYKMLDFLLLRAQDAQLWSRQQPDTLRYLVVDELHTFDGAQGTDLACLIRRLKGRLQTPPGQLVCVGTSPRWVEAHLARLAPPTWWPLPVTSLVNCSMPRRSLPKTACQWPNTWREKMSCTRTCPACRIWRRSIPMATTTRQTGWPPRCHSGLESRWRHGCRSRRRQQTVVRVWRAPVRMCLPNGQPIRPGHM